MMEEIQEKDIDFKKLESPGEMFTLLRAENTPEFWLKYNRISKMFQKKFLYLSDEFRDKKTVDRIMIDYLFGHYYGAPFSIFYEMGDFQGLIGFTKIRPGYRCGMTFKIWDRNLYGKDFVRATRNLIDLYMDTFKLKRMFTESADRKLIKGARMLGFTQEGEQEYGFKWNGKFYTNYLFGKVSNNGDSGKVSSNGDIQCAKEKK